jgi:dolichol kinase
MRLDRDLLYVEKERKLFHIAWLILPVLYYFGYPKICMILLLSCEIIIWAFLEVAKRSGYSVFSPAYLREHENKGMPNGSFFLLISFLLAVLLFNKTIAILAMMFNCIGDSVSGYAGAMLYHYVGTGKTAIREFSLKLAPVRVSTLIQDFAYAVSHRKSIIIMSATFISCMAVGLLAYPGSTIYLIAAGAIGAVVADSFAWQVLGITLNDDFTITVIAGLTMFLTTITWSP